MPKKEFKIIVDEEGKTTISLQGYELESQKIAQEFEEALGSKPSSVKWEPKQHLNATVKARH